MKEPEKILLIRPDRLGDLILSLPAAEALKEKFPDATLSYFASAYASKIAPMVSYVDNWIPDSDKRGSRMSFGLLTREFRKGVFNIAIDLKPSWRTSAAVFSAGIPVRIGTSRRAYSIFYNKKVKIHRRSSGKHQTDLELAHLVPLGIEVSGLKPNLELPDTASESAAELIGANDRPYVVIHPGSGGSSPNWPFESYMELAEKISKEISYNAVITNHEPLNREMGGCIDLSGKTDMMALAGVIKGASLFISGSTGPLHLADALGVCCVSFFTDRDDIGPVRWGPRGNMDNVILPPEKCRCKNGDVCRCLERVSVDLVFERVKNILASKIENKVGLK